jgi:putative oxidoreductase
MRERYAGLYRHDDVLSRLLSLDAALLVGRILIAILFIRAGTLKLMALDATAGYINTKLGMGSVLAPLTGLFELLTGLLIAVGFQTRTVAAVVFLFTAAASLIFHDYWNMTGQPAVANATNFYKNLAIMGGLLILFAAGPGRYSLDKR